MATRNPESRVATATGTATAPAIAVVRDSSVRSPVSATASAAPCDRSGGMRIDAMTCALKYAAAKSNPTITITTPTLASPACQGSRPPVAVASHTQMSPAKPMASCAAALCQMLRDLASSYAARPDSSVAIAVFDADRLGPMAARTAKSIPVPSPTATTPGSTTTGTLTPTNSWVSSPALATTGLAMTIPMRTPMTDPAAPSRAASARNPLSADSGDAPRAAAIAISRRRSSTDNRVSWAIRMTPTPTATRAKIASSGKITMLTLNPLAGSLRVRTLYPGPNALARRVRTSSMSPDSRSLGDDPRRIPGGGQVGCHLKSHEGQDNLGTSDVPGLLATVT